MLDAHLHKLVAWGVISEKEVAEARSSEWGKKGRLVRALVSLPGWDKKRKRKLFGAIARLARVPFVPLERAQVDEATVRGAALDDCLRLGFLPLWPLGKELLVAVEDPLDLDRLDTIRFKLGVPIHPLLADPELIEKKAREAYGAGPNMDAMLDNIEDGAELETEAVRDEEQAIDQIKQGAQESPVVKLVNGILLKALEVGSSDIHIEPEEDAGVVRMRIDGRLRRVLRYPRARHAHIVARIKVMADLDISNTRTPQDGRARIKALGKSYDLRISTLPSLVGEKVVLRVLDKSGLSLKLEDLGIHPKMLPLVKECIKRPTGAVLVTGPTGSGKTTTLYSFLHYIHDEETNIITVEDPVEFRIKGINQVQINPKAGLTFAAALRSILRQDPDVVMVGEIRDEETAEITMHAAQTGHLVLSTLHTNDAPSTIARLLEMGIDGPTLAASLSLIVAQRLVRRLCPKCKEEARLDPDIKERFGIPDEVKLYGPGGCKRCLGIGYKGRMGVHEILYVNDRLRELIAKEAPAREIALAAREEGMLTLFEDGLAKALQGHTSLDEVLRIAVPPEGFKLADRLGPNGELLSLPEAKMLRAAKRGEAASGKRVVLVVDDSATIRKLVRYVLVGEGFEVIEAEDGERAWAMLQTTRPDLVLVDFEMPGLTGPELIKKARADSRFDDLPFVMLTSRQEEENEVLALETGADDYITKPIEPMKLVARVKKVLSMYERIRG
ncbi:MAG: response regulator, partial [Zetaproteobacteria bacterium]